MPIREKIILVIFVAAVASIYLVEAILLSRFAHKKTREKYRRTLLTKRAIVLHFIAIAGMLCVLYGYFIEPYRIEVNFIPIRTNKLSNTSFRIVQISDLHCDKRPANEKTIVKMVNELKPDIIVFTGDALNRPSFLPVFKETMKNLDAPFGKFAVYGNWETNHWPNLDYYSQTGFELLDANTVRLEKNGEAITISGLSCNNPQADWRTLHGLSNETYNIFLFHYPEFIKSVKNFNVDLYLCGHTHGGQIAIPFYGALITMSKTGKKYESGMYSVGKTIMYVNRGLGMDIYPPRIRLFVRPEIAVFDIGPTVSKVSSQ
jgi:predicted MPP superfamily phosphohydrolase